MNIVKDIFSGWLKVDYRTLGIYRILLGLVCFIDIFRRLPYIEVFYTNNGVAPNQFMSDIASKYSTKAFSLLSSLGSTYEVSIFFYIGAAPERAQRRSTPPCPTGSPRSRR